MVTAGASDSRPVESMDNLAHDVVETYQLGVIVDRLNAACSPAGRS